MKKAALGFIALAMSLMANTAQALNGNGDIRSIDPCDQYGYVIPNGSISQPYTVGQTAYFRLRLENPNSVDSWDTKNSANPLVSPWQLSWDSTMYPGLSLSDMLAMYPPAIGVTVSGKTRAARLQVNVPAGEGWYTDIICSYKVEPGDFALPMTLVSDNGKCMLGVASLAGNAINRSALWKLVSYTHDDKNNWGVITATNTCSLVWSDTSELYNNGPSASEHDNWCADLTLAQAGLYIKTIDFASSTYTVPQGRTERVGVNIVGGVNTNGNGTVYVKIKKDGAAVALDEESLEEIEMWDGESTATYQVAKVTIPSGPDASSFSFKVKGLIEGGTNKVYLSSTKEFAYEDGNVGNGPGIVTNFVTASVVCVAPPPPYISVTLDGESRKTVTSGQGYANYAAKLTVTLSEAYTSDVEVSVATTLDGLAVKPGTNYIGMSTFSDGGFLGTNNVVRFSVSEMSAGTLSKDLYVYVLGGDANTAAIDKGIVFTPEAQGASASYFDNENRTATLFINRSTPVILSPEENYVHPEINGGVQTAFKVKIADDYMNMKSAYSVEWWIDGAGTPESGLTALTPSSEGELTVPVTYIAEGEHTTAFRVKNSSGAYSAERHFIVPVRKPKTVKAMVLESGDSSGRYTEDVGELNIRFVLSEPYNRSTQPIYAYLVPLNAATSNQVDCTGLAFTEGVAILPGQTTSFMDAAIKILDGTNGALFRFKVVLSTQEQNTGNISLIGEYASQDLYIPVINKAPIISSVGMSGSLPVTANGQTFKGKAAVGLNKVFTLTADDVEADLTNNVTVTWNFSDPNGYLFTTNMTGLLSEIKLMNTFEVAGTYDCSVKIKDKDMSDSEFAKLAPFEFKVVVSEKPALIIEFPNSNTFNETDADKGLSYFDVKLSAAASRQIEVEVKCVGVPGASGVMNIATTNLTFRAGQMSQRVVIDELDGTADSLSFKGGFTVTAMVVTTTSNEDGTPWKDVYDSTTEKMYVANEAPVIVFPMETGTTNDASINVDYPLAWKIADVDADLENGLSVVWTTSEGVRWVAEGDDLVEGVFTNKFKSGGAKTVTMTVTDKDGGVNSVTLYYKVAASKQVYVYPMGPYYGGLTPLSKMYASANGIGEGRAWADGTRATESFAHTYTYGATMGTAKISANGYANGQEDRDINMAGNSYVDGDTAYKYSDPLSRDSFFYAWVIASKEEDATTYTGSALVSPVSPKAKSGTVQYPLSLPLELAGDEANPMYPDRFIEAFFSKEYYISDNMGDMNADRIPDYFATLYWSMPTGESKTVPEAMTGQAISSSGGEEGEGESATASDLANIATYNDDLDFLPEAWSSPNPLKPSNCSWAPGQPFSMLREIRGLGDGLNEPRISDYELTDAETAALYAACALAGEPAADYADATNWATKVGWTPEAINTHSGARLNPLDPDTDGDGLDDGWEYYFWYYSKFGAVVNGVWSRLEGRRFDSASATLSARISSEEIAEAFDPHVARATQTDFGMDFDNDGLTDLEEYVLGTNPCDWDSDGDGACDLWEVMMGLNPCAFEVDQNPDCDFMARCDYAEDTFTFYTLSDGRVFALPTATASSFVPAEPASTSEYFKVEVAVGGDVATYWAETSPVVYKVDDVAYLAKSVDAFAALEIGGVMYRGEAVVIAPGTAVTVADVSEPVLVAAISETGLDWIDPKTNNKSSTTEALELFNYGGDGATYVPCTSNVTTYAKIPALAEVVKVQSGMKVTLLHNQVMAQYGFDPRVAWNINEFGFLDDRWRRRNSEETGSMGYSGVPTNTVEYTSRDEFLLAQYRMNAQKDEFLGALGITPSVASYSLLTTFPNLPLDFVRGLEYSHNPFVATNSTYLAYWDTLSKNVSVHGADTDDDGMPDGWELYVNANPNLLSDASLYSHDKDELSMVQEYAGVDSCNAYTNRFNKAGELVYPEVESITKNNPGKTAGWWNKFFPTNPHDADTDGDGLEDHKERDSRSGTFPVGRSAYAGVSFTFIYGDNAEKYAADATTVCFRGGGLNPCSVDTDLDLLPDAWEYEFAGIVFKDGAASVSLSDSDFLTLVQGDGLQSALDSNVVAQIRGGMDGTFAKDANWDFDHDGLLNFQEYLVQSLRHLRYDDKLTPLMGVDPRTRQFVRFLPFSAWDGNSFHEKCKASGFPGIGAWQFDKLGYFTLPPHSWDPVALNTTGLENCKNYAHSEGAGYRVMLRPIVEIPGQKEPQKATGYASTDPRRWDTDNDGMDDYYEIFHGLNPLLGSAADPLERNEQGLNNYASYDVIGAIYGGAVNSWCNHWTDWSLGTQPEFDAIKYPWMIGTMECDADGDGLRNDEEALKVDVAAPRNTHTDPTPLWMTDSTSAKFASFTAQYYGPDPYLSETPGYNEITSHHDLFCYPWTDLHWSTVVYAPGSGGINRDWMFSFEENEGYDTDGDFKRDSAELVKGVDPTSDPLNFMDPNRRQALYLPGEESAAVSYDSESRRSIGTEPDLLKQFTVECWVRPDGAQDDVVIMERVCVYGASTLSNNQTYVRANFRIGIDAEGRVYGEYEGTTADSGRITLTGRELVADVWTHVAFTYNGYTAALYINGEVAPVASMNGVGLIPANGIDGILQESGTSVVPYTGYRALPCANIIGARALTPDAVSVNPETTWDDFDGFYKGWIDEVRVWDGARTPSEIHASYLKRYSFEDVAAQRETVYKEWRNGVTRADSNAALPAELLLHYNFVTLPGGTEPHNVLTEPTGFFSAVLDNVRKPNISDLDDALDVGWWSQLEAINSKVYGNYAVVPWIPNTVAHLPVMDGSSIDSQYWSSYAAGLIGKQDLSQGGYGYPNTANPYSSYVHRFDKLNHLNRLAVAGTLQLSDSTGYPIYDRYLFQLRSDFVGTTDLVPLGGAFAKRGVDFWDGQGAMDAWTETSASGEIADADANGIPDWAEGLGYTTAEAYIRALAEGLLPSTDTEVKNGAYADRTDADHDGLVDWWQRMNDLKSEAQDDSDKDGLADFAEYLASDVFKFGDISPVLAKTDGNEFDYFLKVGKLYLGELFTDHDFIEDEWENRFPNSIVSAANYDPHADPDADGWSNYAECRAGTLPDRTATITAEGQQVPDYPEPMISVKAFYRNAAQVSAPIVVKSYSGDDFSVANATWNIPGSDEAITYERVLGVNPKVKSKYLLGPSVVVPGTLLVYMRDPAEYHVTNNKGVWSASSYWREVLKESPVAGNNLGANIAAGVSGEVVGSVVYRTGEVEIDFSALPTYRYEMVDEVKGDGQADALAGTYTFYPPQTNTYIRSNLNQSYVKIQWQSKRLVGEAQWDFALGRASVGHVHEGRNTFVVFVDLDGDGEYSSGEPMGVVRDVDVGWNSAEFSVELTDTTPICQRPSIEGVSTNGTSVAYVYRYSVDDLLVPPSTLDYGPVVTRDIGSRTYMHEGDFLANGDFDLDWAGFKKSVLNNITVVSGDLLVNKVVYRAYFQQVDIAEEVLNTNNTPYVEIVREFGDTHAKGVAISPGESSTIFYGNRPTFKWKIEGDRPDTYTAFAIQIKSGDDEIWNSGVQMLPPRNASGEYVWTAPLYVGDLLACGEVFGGRDNYKWSVSVYNSKFQSNNWSEARLFRMNVYADDEVNNAGTYSFKGCVKYFGAGAFSTTTSTMKGIVRVEAYSTPDFSGMPVARTVVRDSASVTNESHAANVTFAGLETGTYYLRAYIDSDGDGKRSPWESWGYACGRGDIVTGAIYAPTAITVGLGLSPLEVVYIEDTDVDQDCLPDVYEYDAASGKEGFLAVKGPSSNSKDGYIAVNPELANDISRNSGNTVAYMLSAGTMSMPSDMVALSLGIETAENTLEESTLAIKAISLENGAVNLTVGAEANEPDLGKLYVKGNTVTVTIVIKYADSLNGEWKEKCIGKTFEIEGGNVDGVLTITNKELMDAGLDTSRGFFKVGLK